MKYQFEIKEPITCCNLCPFCCFAETGIETVYCCIDNIEIDNVSIIPSDCRLKEVK